MTPGNQNNNNRDVKDYEQNDATDDYDDTSDYDDAEPVEDDVNIDDGLLDDVFDESASDTSAVSPRNSNNGAGGSQCNSCDMAVCVMGGSNDQGAVSEVASVTAGSQYARTPRGLYIQPFPSFMTRGNGQTFSFYTKSNDLYSCTPGYTVSSYSPFTGRLEYQAVPGNCNNYDFSSGQWTSRGGPMSSFRQSGQLVNVGSYIMAVGGVGQSGQLNTQVELFDPRRPQVGWQNVPKYRMTRGVSESCSVVTRDLRLGPQVMMIGGSGQGRGVTKLVLSSNQWFSSSPMRQPRRNHACVSLSLNGRPGVVVSGGIGNSTSVEFWDMKTDTWLDLPSLSRGRRSHSMTTIQGKMAVAGGVGTNRRGEDEFLDDVEIFDGKRWRRASSGLDQPRQGANLVKIPYTRFRG